VVNVHIHQFRGGGAVVDASAMEQFQTQWATYQKLVDHDLLSHRAVGNLLDPAPFDECCSALRVTSFEPRIVVWTNLRAAGCLLFEFGHESYRLSALHPLASH